MSKLLIVLGAISLSIGVIYILIRPKDPEIERVRCFPSTGLFIVSETYSPLAGFGCRCIYRIRKNEYVSIYPLSDTYCQSRE